MNWYDRSSVAILEAVPVSVAEDSSGSYAFECVIRSWMSTREASWAVVSSVYSAGSVLTLGGLGV